MPRSTDELSDANIPAIFLAEAEEDDVEANLDFQAMMHLNDDESPEESAKNYREEGNAHFRKGKQFCKNAIESYTKALRHNIDVPIPLRLGSKVQFIMLLQ